MAMWFSTRFTAPVSGVISLRPGQTMERAELLPRLVEHRYERNDVAFARNRFRVRGDAVDINPA